MTDGPIRAVLAAERDGPPGRLVELDPSDLPEGDVTVRVRYSSLNYKDGLAVTGKGPVVRKFPMVCGVDLAGTVEESTAPGHRSQGTRSSSPASGSGRTTSAGSPTSPG